MIIETDFLDHWKTRLIVRLLGTESAPLHIIRLWSHCQTRKTNRFPDWNPEILSAVCKWGGDANVFWSAILQTFGRIEDGCFVAHQWDEVNSSLIASWSNGGKGGRPKKPRDNPRVNPDLNPVIPQVTHGVTDREEKIEKIDYSSESDSLRSRINKWFSRRENTEWSKKELKALSLIVKLRTPESDLQLLDARYQSKNKYRRKDILTLLNNWNSEIDRCKSGDDSEPQNGTFQVEVPAHLSLDLKDYL
jgi:hypothetical protein